MKWLVLIVCAFCLSEARIGEGATVREDNIIGAIDPALEKRIGALMLQNVLRTNSQSSDKPQVHLVNEIGQRILNAIDDDGLTDDWQFLVIDSEAVNAFSLPGGKILIFSGLLSEITTDGKTDTGMLAAIIGHEIAHMRMHHGLESLRNAASMEWIIDNLDRLNGESAQSWNDEQKRLLGEMARARFTREQEFEADQLGSLYAALAGYGFDGIIRWSELESQKIGDNGMTEYVPEQLANGKIAAQDHPTWSERIAKARVFQGRLLNIAGEFTWGSEMLKVGNLDKAVQCFKDVVVTFPNCFEAWNNLGNAYHRRYLQTQKVAALKFQIQLVDYCRDLRETVRGSGGLQAAIQAYRRAKQLDPGRLGVRLNLATALLQDALMNPAHREDDLGEAAQLLDGLLAKRPNEPAFLNAKAILFYAKEPKGDSASAAGIFARAAAQNYLPAKFNLAIAQLEAGRKTEGVAELRNYLAGDSRSPWADFARATLQARHEEAPPKTERPIVPLVDSVLKVRLGATRDQLVSILHAPERLESCTIGENYPAAILWYDSIGAAFLLANDQVVSVILFPQVQPPDYDLGGNSLPAPEIAGVSIGGSQEDIEKAFGRATQMTSAPGRDEKVYSYLSSAARVDFRMKSSRIYSIILSKRT